MESGGDANRRRQSSSEGEKTDSANLRDLLRVKEDDGRNDRCRLTLSDVLSVEKRPSVQSTRTLLDIIRDDAIGDKDGKKSWKQLREKLRLHRAGASCISSVQVPGSGFPIQQNSNRIMAQHHSTELGTTSAPDLEDNPNTELTQPAISFLSNNAGDHMGELNSIPNNRVMRQLNTNESTVSEFAEQNQRTIDNIVSESADRNQRTSEGTVSELAERNQQAPLPAAEESVGPEQPARMSLMALLAETEGQMVIDGSVHAMDGDDDRKEKGVGDYNNCCVCMVRHKGAAFIPCGHTFCRLCCRELWVQRGNCPLCNGFIVEILDIF